MKKTSRRGGESDDQQRTAVDRAGRGEGRGWSSGEWWDFEEALDAGHDMGLPVTTTLSGRSPRTHTAHPLDVRRHEVDRLVDPLRREPTFVGSNSPVVGGTVSLAVSWDQVIRSSLG